MVFRAGDIYTSSGSVKLYNSWTPTVAKFDTSSFYNWEQDNMPLYDLEERTYESWEQAGFPTSGLTGFALTVSADANTASLQANSNLFTDLSSCIAAIPKIVRFPVLIEVCNFGNLGKLELHNFRIEEGGSIEIINRAYSKVYTTSSCIMGVTTPTYNVSVPLITKFIAADLSATLFSGIGQTNGVCTSGINVVSPVLTVTDSTNKSGGSRLSSVYTFLYPDLESKQAPLTVGIQNTVANFAPGNLGNTADDNFFFGVDPYENVNTDNTIGTSYDFSCINPLDDGLMRRAAPTINTSAGGSVYLNHLMKLSIKNCDGPIYVRNFVVDGYNQTVNTGRPTGIEVTNSDVVLENCAAVRCREAGFKFNNSKVMLSRSAFAYRNYDLSADNARYPDRGIGFHAVNSDVTLSANLSATVERAVPGEFQGSGIDVMMCASRNTTGMRLDNSKFTGGVGRSVSNNIQTGGISTFELNSKNGIELYNSNLNLVGLLDVYSNPEGIVVENSNLKYRDLCVEDQQHTGLVATNSKISVDSSAYPGAAGQTRSRQTDFSHNGQHIDLQSNSHFTFVKKPNIPNLYGNMSFLYAHGRETYTGASQPVLTYPAINVENSKADFLNAYILPRDVDNATIAPQYGLAVRAINNSTVDFYGTKNGATFIIGPTTYVTQQYAAGIYAKNNSTLGLHGPTFIGQFGVDALVEDNSVLNINPPIEKATYLPAVSAFDLSDTGNHTSVELHSTRACLVANKNSTINLENLGAFDHCWDNSPTGRTVMDYGVDYDIQSPYGLSGLFGAGCLQFFPNPQNSNAMGDNDFANLSANNGPGNKALTQFRALISPTFTTHTTNTDGNPNVINQFTVAQDYYGGAFPATGGDMRRACVGGVCVRATGDSQVNAINVNFPIGLNSTPMDGIYFNVSGTECDRLMIWNFADTSRLNASYCSVSAMYPYDVGYHGPSAVWASATMPDNSAETDAGVAASGAPSSTPETGILSVLDTFGAGSSVWYAPSGVGFNEPFGRFITVSSSYNNNNTIGGNPLQEITHAGIAMSGLGFVGQVSTRMDGTDAGIYGAGVDTYENQGVFRLYFSTKPETKLLQNDMSGYHNGTPLGHEFYGVLGPAYQVYSQCYNMSGPLSALMTDPNNAFSNISGTYPNLLKLSHDSDGDGIFDSLWTSGFYYCEEFVDDNPTQCLLDESAANTFANAKNASIGMSGRPKKVTIYRARASDQIGAEANEGNASATVGFKSSNIFDLKRDN